MATMCLEGDRKIVPIKRDLDLEAAIYGVQTSTSNNKIAWNARKQEHLLIYGI